MSDVPLTPQLAPQLVAPRPGKAAFWTGWVVGGLAALGLLAGGVTDLVKPPFVVEGLARAGYPESVIVPLGVVIIACVILYLIPTTAAVGAILLTGYFGGAVATHVRIGDPASMWLVPLVYAVVLWTALVLRDRRLRVVLPGH